MKNLALRVRISMLWLFMAVAMSAHMVLSFFEPGVVELILSGGFAEYQSKEIFLFYALFWLIPLTMAFLSVTLKDSTTRQANIVVGTVLTISNIGHLFFELVIKRHLGIEINEKIHFHSAQFKDVFVLWVIDYYQSRFGLSLNEKAISLV